MENSSTPDMQNTIDLRRKTRTRSGCLNCRRRRRKCDGERIPGCLRCRQRDEKCEWGMRVTFRPDNAIGLASEHPSMLQEGSRKRPQSFQILDVSSQIEREYLQENPEDSNDSFLCTDSSQENVRGQNSLEMVQPYSARERDSWDPRHSPLAPTDSVDLGSPVSMDMGPHIESFIGASHMPNYPSREAPTPQSLVVEGSGSEDPSRVTLLHMEDAAAELLALRYLNQPFHAGPLLQDQAPIGASEIPSSSTSIFDVFESQRTPGHDLTDEGNLRFISESITQELIATLTDHSRDRNCSNAVTRCNTPEQQYAVERLKTTPEREYALWKNWIDEVAPWLDKFDNQRHFERQIPFLAKNAPYLKNSILALSARQLERKANSTSSSESLALYQEAIHLLLPELHSKSPAVTASCVILCVLEMMSCSPKEWRRHLEGCAKLLEISGINGFFGGIEEALFWCFARMDVCGALISEDLTLIPASHFASTGSLADDIKLFRNPTKSFETYANYAVFLGATCVSYLHEYNCRSMGITDLAERWTELYNLLDDWETDRPEEMKPILTIPANEKPEDSPFPTILYGNGPAVSGNQLYHTAMLLLLQKKPRGLTMQRKQKSIFWHARQICAISESNTHHGAWTNCIQPIWIAGKVMSHHSEHRAILDIYERIERETGWITTWRRDDLKRWWGEFDD